jgi:VanZ family protein
MSFGLPAATSFALSLAYLGLRERLIFWFGLATASGVFEILQIWIPGRDAKIQDALASTFGLTTGLVLGAMAAVKLFAEIPVDNREKRRE